MVALIPADIGKPIAKLEKAPIVDGSCTWADPIYEMVKLVKNQKTDTYKEKIYFFNVQTVRKLINYKFNVIFGEFFGSVVMFYWFS